MDVEKMTAWIKKPSVKYGLVMIECGVPQITEDQVLLKVLATGICGTDLSIYKGYRKVPDDLIPGHEFIGEIIKVGKNVTGYAVGERVIPSIIHRCGKCRACINGYEAQCENLEEVGIHIDGSFAEYAAVPAATLHKVRSDMDITVGASVEPVAVAYSAVKKAEQFIPGKDVIIYGPGPIGLYITQLVKLAGAGKIVLIGTKNPRLQLARTQYGVEIININQDDVDEKLKEYFPKGRGKADIIFEATGVADSIGEMVSRLSAHGELVLTGIFKEPSQIDLLQMIRGELTIRSSFCYTLSEFEYAIKLVEENRILFDGIVENMPLENLDVGFERQLSREAIKVVVIP